MVGEIWGNPNQTLKHCEIHPRDDFQIRKPYSDARSGQLPGAFMVACNFSEPLLKE